MKSSTVAKIVQQVQLEMYYFKSSIHIVDCEDSDIESELSESRGSTNSSSKDERGSKYIDIGTARASVDENVCATAVDAKDGDITDWYQATFEAGFAINSTTDTGPDTWSFVKCMSVVMEPRSSGEKESDGVFG